MPDLDSYPFVASLLFLFMVAMLRGQGTYWLGRAFTAGATRATSADGPRTGLRGWLTSPALDKGRAVLERWGTPAIALCYLTIGVQTLVLAAAGVLRMNWWRFTFAQIFGAIAWAVIYSTVGFGVWASFVAGGVWALLVIVAVIGIVAVLLSRRRARHAQPSEGAAVKSTSAQ